MKLGVVSDTHSRHETVRAAVSLLQERGAQLLLHCGDIEDAETVRLFAGIPTHFVFGNWDRDTVGLTAAIQEIGGTLHEQFGYLELAGRKVAWVHSHDKALFRDLKRYEGLDYLFYGHTHQVGQYRLGSLNVVNPGALFRAAPKTVALVDLRGDSVEFLRVG